MKKALSLALVVLMVVAAFAVFTFTASAETTKIDIYGSGMENWANSPNKGAEGAVTQILFCPKPWNNDVYKTYEGAGKMVTVNMKAVDGSSDDTFTIPVVTVYAGGSWGILRLEPCIAEDKWVPVKDKEYTATFTFEDADGDTVTMACETPYKITVDPIVPAPAEENQLKGYNFDGIAVHGGKMCYTYDFDLKPEENPITSKEIRDSKDAKFTITLTKGGVETTKPTTVAFVKSWGDDDNALSFDVEAFGLKAGDEITKAKIVIEIGGKTYFVVAEAEADKPWVVPTATPITEDVSGSFEGTDVKWKIFAATKTLVIYGTGAMPDFGSNTETPWAEYAPYIQALRVKSGVTKVGKNTASKTGITEAVFEEGVEEIAMDCFAYCDSLTNVYFPKSLKKIGQGVGYGSAIEATNYAGTEAEFNAEFKTEDGKWKNSSGSPDDVRIGEYNLNDGIKLKSLLKFGVELPADPNPDPNQGGQDNPPDNPPQTGTMTVVFVAMAVVALFGTALVSKKVFDR